MVPSSGRRVLETKVWVLGLSLLLSTAMCRVRQHVFVSTSTPTHIYICISLTMDTENHDFTLTYPIPINTTGFILVFSSTFVPPFADSDKSGCQSLMYLFIWSVSLDVTGLLSLPPLWALLYSSHSGSSSLHWVVLTWMPSLPSLDLMLSVRQPCTCPYPQHMNTFILGSDYPAGPFSAGTLSTLVGFQYPPPWELNMPYWAASLWRCLLSLLRCWYPLWALWFPLPQHPYLLHAALPNGFSCELFRKGRGTGGLWDFLHKCLVLLKNSFGA